MTHTEAVDKIKAAGFGAQVVLDAMKDAGKAFIDVHSQWMNNGENLKLCRIEWYADGTYSAGEALVGDWLKPEYVERATQHYQTVLSAIT